MFTVRYPNGQAQGGTVDLVLCLCLVFAWIWAFRFVQKKTTLIPLPQQEGYSRGYERSDWEDEGKVFAWIGLGVAFIVVGVLVIGSAENIVTAFFNPEYWALTKVLAKCR